MKMKKIMWKWKERICIEEKGEKGEKKERKMGNDLQLRYSVGER